MLITTTVRRATPNCSVSPRPNDCAPRPAGLTAPRTRCRTSPCCVGSWWSATRWREFWPSSSQGSVWQSVFISGQGFWTSLENVIVGPFIAMISFVCSIGNVPLAAALWSGGISFGGVISFIFADLIAFPLLMIYRRYYGPRLMLRMLVVFWALMSTAGLITEGIFGAAGLIPAVRPTNIAPAHFSWNYTTYLNLVFLALFGVLYWTYRNRERLGAGTGYAKDPVCGMQVEIDHAPASLRQGGGRYYFCSDHCAERFGTDPESHASHPEHAENYGYHTDTDSEPAQAGAPKEATI